MLPILSIQQMRQWEKATWATGQTEEHVIQLVGKKLAARIVELSSSGDAILIVAGRGHNGDDARAAIPFMPDRKVFLLNVTDPQRGQVEFLDFIKRCGKQRPKWIVDALFGIGLSRPLDEHWCKLIETLNGSSTPILAVDVPSGLNVDTGKTEGAAIRAELTLTVGAPKTGLLKAPAFTGKVEVISDVGFAECSIDSELNWTTPDDFEGLPPRRPVDGNKGTFGHVAIIAGSGGYHGAAVLSARGALRARPGLVSVYPQAQAYIPVASQLQSAMVHVWKGESHPKNCTAILFGPGLAGKDVPDFLKEQVKELWHNTSLAMIVDASALDWLESGPTPQNAVRLITPHPGEAGRMLGSNAKQVQSDRLGALRALSKKFGDCIVVLKGHQTLVGRSTGKVFVNNSGNPYLAQGGSGDLLSGYVAGLLAQADWRRNPLLTVRYAVWQHGASADALSRVRRNWTIEDLSAHLGEEGVGE
ncbi:MAG TPA: NAD(P)H-hydrate dehydratase [Verrucomicrobiae bacterium]|jgi:NAD(P)H-hydrate epimerase